jgi:hypothetical protein
VPAGRLPLIADALNVAYFYGFDQAVAGVDTAAADCIALMAERGAVELLTCFHAMTSSQRGVFLELGKLIAAGNGDITGEKGGIASPRRTPARQNGSAPPLGPAERQPSPCDDLPPPYRS